MVRSSKFKASRLLFLTLFAFLLSASAFAANTVEGIIVDPKGNLLSDVDVELLNENQMMLQHSRTDESGRYVFPGLADGRFFVQVRPFRYDYEEQMQEVYFSSFSVTGGTGSASEFRNFTLQPRKGSLAYTENAVIFAQDVPDDARKFYQTGMALMKKRDVASATSNLESAVKAFPRYFMAHYALGEIYFQKSDWDSAKKHFLLAADINPKSPKSFYRLGLSLERMGSATQNQGYYAGALMSLNQALILSPMSGEVLFMMGKIEISMSKYPEAEKHLIQAKKSSNNPNPEVYWELSQLYGKYLKRYGDAAQELQAYIKTLPDTEDAAAKANIQRMKTLLKNLKDLAAKEDQTKSKTTE